MAGGKRPRLPNTQDPTVKVSDNLALTLSKSGVDFIQRHETGGQAYYNKRYTGVIWPGGASGGTVGVGYDCGYNSRTQITKDWKGVATPSELSILLSMSGVKGSRAKAFAKRYKGAVHITWGEAQSVFVRSTLPRFTGYTATAFRLQKDTLHPHSNSALTSLVFNRGSSMSSKSSRNEMRNIRTHLAAGKPELVPAEFRKMKRLWVGKGLDGLLRRRDEEADFFQSGLDIRNHTYAKPTKFTTR